MEGPGTTAHNVHGTPAQVSDVQGRPVLACRSMTDTGAPTPPTPPALPGPPPSWVAGRGVPVPREPAGSRGCWPRSGRSDDDRSPPSTLVLCGVVGVLGGVLLVGHRPGLGAALVGLLVWAAAAPALIRRRNVNDLVTAALSITLVRRRRGPRRGLGRRALRARRRLDRRGRRDVVPVGTGRRARAAHLGGRHRPGAAVGGQGPRDPGRLAPRTAAGRAAQRRRSPSGCCWCSACCSPAPTASSPSLMPRVQARPAPGPGRRRRARRRRRGDASRTSLSHRPAGPTPGSRRGTAARRGEWLLPVVALDAMVLLFVTVQVGALLGGHRHVLETEGLTYARVRAAGVRAAGRGHRAHARRRRGRRPTRTPRDPDGPAAVPAGARCRCASAPWASWRPRCAGWTCTSTRSGSRGCASSSPSPRSRSPRSSCCCSSRGSGGAAGGCRAPSSRWSRVAMLGLALVNPDAQIVRHNTTADLVADLDVDYLAGLSADAVPGVRRRSRAIRRCARCLLASARRHRRPRASATGTSAGSARRRCSRRAAGDRRVVRVGPVTAVRRGPASSSSTGARDARSRGQGHQAEHERAR